MKFLFYKMSFLNNFKFNELIIIKFLYKIQGFTGNHDQFLKNSN